MCIFSQPVDAVNDTQIFARIKTGGMQCLVYQMNYKSKQTNAMILPVPIKAPSTESSLRFIDLHEYARFFRDLDQGFPRPQSFGCSSVVLSAPKHSLSVYRVGNYVASFVPTLADFSRLDERFSLPDQVWAKIPKYADYGFAVFELAQGTLQPHPMGFEFDSALENTLYFPTMHIHDGQVHDTEEFDHILYLQHAGFDSQVHGYQNPESPDSATGLIRSKYVAKNYCDISASKGILESKLLVHRKIIRGNCSNQDVHIRVFGDPITLTTNIRQFISFLPWLFAGTAVAWIVERRNKLRTIRN
ncbi:MAG: hypothetical protein ABL921_12020 [Pirellula sp.]